MVKLTPQDMSVLRALDVSPKGHSSAVAVAAAIKTSSPSETAARHLIKLTKLDLASQVGTRMFPIWHITPAGRAALTEGEDE